MYIKSRNIFENINQAKKYLKLNDIQDDEKYLKLKDILKKNLGYLGEFTEWMYENEISIDDMQSLYNYFKDPKFRDFTKDLNLNQYKNIEEIYDYLTKMYQDRQVEQVIKTLPSKTRSIANEKLKSLIFNNLEYYNEIKDFYSKKGGRYKRINDLISDTKAFIENLSGPWNSKTISKNLTPDEIVYIDDQTLIAWIKDYERSCAVGSKSWCISTDEDHFKQYTENFKKQYFIWDFTRDISDKLSLIGVTISANGNPTSIHFKDDTKGYKKDIEDYLKWLKPYSENYIEKLIDKDSWEEVIGVGIPRFVKRLIESGFDPSAYGNFAIGWASRNGHTEVVKILLDDERVDPSDRDNLAIRYASYNGHTEIVKILLDDERVDPSAYGNWAIQVASENGHTEIVKLLLDDERVDPSNRDNFAIRWASRNGHTEVVKILLEDERVDPTADDNYAIRWASKGGHTEVVKILIEDERVRSKLTQEEIKYYLFFK